VCNQDSLQRVIAIMSQVPVYQAKIEHMKRIMAATTATISKVERQVCERSACVAHAWSAHCLSVVLYSPGDGSGWHCTKGKCCVSYLHVVRLCVPAQGVESQVTRVGSCGGVCW
jgi:hypothetical protein